MDVANRFPQGCPNILPIFSQYCPTDGGDIMEAQRTQKWGGNVK